MSSVIFNKVVSHSFFLEAENILCFLNYQSEVETKNIIKKAWEEGKRVYVPRIDEDIMNFYQITSFQDLIKGYKGILEPVGDHIFDMKDGLVIMPGVAFDKCRNRIGYGKGFYDKFLCLHPSLKTIAIAFELQIVDEIPYDSLDIIPEILITEENIYDSKFTE